MSMPTMPEHAQRKNALVPIWIVNSNNAALAKMTKRPVVTVIDELELTLRGEVVDLTMSHAQVRPETQFYLCKSVYAEIAFRFEETQYTLSGEALPSAADQSFRIEFDTVARKTMHALGVRLSEAGLLEAQSAAPQASEKTPKTAAPATKGEQHAARTPRARHDPPPDGVEQGRSQRFPIETAARLTLVNEGKRIDCTMIELGRCGCRLRFEAECALECGVHVEVQFVGDGLPLRLAAVVASRSHPHVTGLRFVNVGTRMQERLHGLLEEITRGQAIAAGRE